MKSRLRKIIILSLLLCILLTGSALVAEPAGNHLNMEAAIDEAIRNNRLVHEAIEREQAAVQGEKKVRADLLPKLSTSYTYSHLRHDPYTFFGSRKIIVGPRDNILWDFTVTQPLFTGFALTTKRKIAALDIDIRKILREQAILDVIKQVKVAYLNILLARRALEVADEEVNQLQAHVHDAEQLYGQGIIPYNDLLKSRVALAQALQNKTKAKSNLDVAVSALNALLNREITSRTEIEELPPFTPGQYEITTLFKEALHNRPELKQLKIAIKQAELGIRLAKSSYYPQVFLNGRYERKGDDWEASHNTFSNDHNTSVTLQLTWSLFEWGKRRAGIAEATHKKRALEEKMAGIKDSILLEVKQAYQDLKVAEENIHTATEALKQAKENFRITNLQYREGITTSTEVLDARTFLTQAEFNYHRALYGYRIAEAELKRAIGVKR